MVGGVVAWRGRIGDGCGGGGGGLGVGGWLGWGFREQWMNW